MPHFVLEYSENVLDQLDPESIFKNLHETLVKSGPFTMSAIKSRSVKHSVFRIGGGAVIMFLCT